MTVNNEAEKSEKKSISFIEQIIVNDLEQGKNGSKVQTRFPPEPNGYLHIGHAKAICMDFGMAQKYNGICNLRFDDTNPTKEDVEYVDAIMEDIKWLGFDWANVYYASDYFDQLWDFAIKLIKEGKAYIDEQTAEQIAEQKGTPTQPGTESPYRNRPIEESLELFRRRALEREGDKSDAEAPHVILFRRAVELDGENVLRKIRELGEKRLAVDAVLVDEPEVGVVEDNDDLAARRGDFGDGLYDLDGIVVRRRVAGRIVREVENQNLLALARQKRLLHRGCIKVAVLEGIEERKLCTRGFLENQRVVIPVKIGNDYLNTALREKLGRNPKTVRKRVGYYGIRKLLALKGRILLDLHLAPLRAKLGNAEAARVEKRLLVEGNPLLE